MRACVAGYSLIACHLDPRLLLTRFHQWAVSGAAGSSEQSKSPSPAVYRLGPEEIPDVRARYVSPVRSCGSMVLNCVSACRAFLGGSVIA
ncbi:hypothetical protein ACVIIY_004809 [Bradyrhizobium sp. USDA 4515]